MKYIAWLIWLPMLAGCAENAPIPEVKIPEGCEQQVYADPAVRDEIMKGLGNAYYRDSNPGPLAYAKLDAVNRCLRRKGLLPQGGGVERPRPAS